MSKNKGFGLSKKDFPGLERVRDETGKRVWQYKGKTYANKRELDMSVNPQKYTQVKFTPKEKVVESVNDVVENLLSNESNIADENT